MGLFNFRSKKPTEDGQPVTPDEFMGSVVQHLAPPHPPLQAAA